MKLYTLLFTLFFYSCSFEKPRKSLKETLYEITCEDKREKSGFKTYVVRKSVWSNPLMYRKSVWRFTDVNGLYVRTNFRCYTDSITKK